MKKTMILTLFALIVASKASASYSGSLNCTSETSASNLAKITWGPTSSDGLTQKAYVQIKHNGALLEKQALFTHRVLSTRVGQDVLSHANLTDTVSIGLTDHVGYFPPTPGYLETVTLGLYIAGEATTPSEWFKCSKSTTNVFMATPNGFDACPDPLPAGASCHAFRFGFACSYQDSSGQMKFCRE